MDELTDSLKGIELTAMGKIPVEKSRRIARDDQILTEPARGIILRILRRGIDDTLTEERIDDDGTTKIIIQKKVTRNALSVSEIVKISKNFEEGKNPLTKSQVYHHLPILIDGDYVIHYGTISTGKRTTEYYRRTAEIFIFESYPAKDKKKLRESMACIIDDVISYFKFDVTPEEREELINLSMETTVIEHESYQKIIPLADGDLADPNFENILRAVIATHSAGSDDWVKARRRMREIFFKE